MLHVNPTGLSRARDLLPHSPAFTSAHTARHQHRPSRDIVSVVVIGVIFAICGSLPFPSFGCGLPCCDTSHIRGPPPQKNSVFASSHEQATTPPSDYTSAQPLRHIPTCNLFRRALEVVTLTYVLTSWLRFEISSSPAAPHRQGRQMPTEPVRQAHGLRRRRYQAERGRRRNAGDTEEM